MLAPGQCYGVAQQAELAPKRPDGMCASPVDEVGEHGFDDRVPAVGDVGVGGGRVVDLRRIFMPVIAEGSISSCEVVDVGLGEKFRLDLEVLAHSAAQVSGQGEDLASAHLSSDNRIAAAQSGWVGRSALALSTKTATWLEDSRRLLTRVGEHALNMNNDGIDFSAMERDNVEKLRAVQPPAGGAAGSA